MDVNDKIKELTLMLLYLTSWEEKEFNGEYRRSWKGYDFDVLNALMDDEMISGNRKSKSVYIEKEGIKKARQLLQKYGIGECAE